jgi:hypothetical protein
MSRPQGRFVVLLKSENAIIGLLKSPKGIRPMTDQTNPPLRNDEGLPMEKLSRAQLESIARWIGAVTSHPDATPEQLEAVYQYVSTARLTDIAETAKSFGY